MMLDAIASLELGPLAAKTALNIVSAGAFLGVAIRYGYWTIRDWQSLRHVALGTLPASVALLMLFGALSAGYYGAARIVSDLAGVDIRDAVELSVPLGALSLFAVALHMVALWRAEGLAVWPRVIRCTALIAIAWAGLTWGLW